MSEHATLAGIAAPLPLNNLDTDQIMPKQFLFGIDKSGLARHLQRGDEGGGRGLAAVHRDQDSFEHD